MALREPALNIFAKLIDQGNSMMCHTLLSIAGLLLNCVGVLTLFYYGLPFRMADAHGRSSNVTENVVSAEQAREDDRHKMRGWIGFWFVVVGTGLQVLGAAIVK